MILTMHGIVLLSALLAARANRAIVGAALVAVVTALVVSGFALIRPGELNEVPAAVVNALFIGVTPVIVARGLIHEIREERTVTIRTMFGVLCIYLLIGVFFAFVYAVIDAETANEFFPNVAPASTSDFLYFSFTTLTTTGYGDLVTANELGRSMAVLEALIGQIYLVTVVALIVANMRRPARASDEELARPRRRCGHNFPMARRNDAKGAAHRARPGRHDGRRCRGQRPQAAEWIERASRGPLRGAPRADDQRLPARGPVLKRRFIEAGRRAALESSLQRSGTSSRSSASPTRTASRTTRLPCSATARPGHLHEDAAAQLRGVRRAALLRARLDSGADRPRRGLDRAHDLRGHLVPRALPRAPRRTPARA